MPLTAQQIAFAWEYVKDFSANKAAIRAGYSENTAYSQGPRLLRNVEVQAIIKEHLNDRKASAEMVLDRLQQQAFADIGDLIQVETVRTKKTGRVRSQKVILDLEAALKSGKSHLIRSVAQTEHGIKVELYSAQDALGLLGKHHKLFDERLHVEHTVEWQGLKALLDRFYGKPEQAAGPAAD